LTALAGRAIAATLSLRLLARGSHLGYYEEALMSEQNQQQQSARDSEGPNQVADDGEHGFGVDEENHGWAPDSGPASEAVREGNRKAWDANDTQAASRGEGDPTPDPDDARLPSENVGQSTSRRGEDVAEQDGKEAGRQDTGPKGASQRPTGTSTARDMTGIDPQEPIEP
jgi:hypothetical protein